MAKREVPLAVIGAGAAGLVIAIGAAKAGKRPLLIEKGPYGGDCTNFGCIPSKALIAASHKAHALRHDKQLGIKAEVTGFTGDGALEWVQQVVQEIRNEEEPDILQQHGVDTLTGIARFDDPHTLIVTMEDGRQETVCARQIVLATGSHPTAPPIPGLDETGYLTNETIFDLTTVPRRLAIIGGGPIGIELAQAFGRLGSQVTVIEYFDQILNRHEPGASQVIADVLSKEGVQFQLNCATEKVERSGADYRLTTRGRESGELTTIEADQLLVAAGRLPNLNKLNLDAAQITHTQKGIQVDAYGRTSQKHIWAVGDVIGAAPFTHMAESQARTVLTNLLNPLPVPFKSRFNTQPFPHVTFCDPEIAGFGMTEQEAVEALGKPAVACYNIPLSQVDRARATGRTEGFVKVVTRKWSSRILGATIVAPRAGEMLMELALAEQQGIPLRKLAHLIHPYPIYNHGIRKAADGWLQQTILPAIKRVLGR